MSPRHLRKLQSAFAAAVYEGRMPAALAELIVGDGLVPAARLGLYRNNTLLNLGDALAAAYPVLQRLLGADCFRALTRAYIGAHPSRSGDLHDYGDALAGFLAGLPELAALPYLADVARLEWLVHRAYFAAEAAPCDLAALLAVPAGDHDRLRLRPHPSLALLESPYPLLAIWQSNQPGAAERVINLAEGGDRLLVCRPLLEVEIERLGAGAYSMLRTLADGARVGAACALAIAAESGFEPGPTLGGWLSRGVLVEAYL